MKAEFVMNTAKKWFFSVGAAILMCLGILLYWNTQLTAKPSNPSVATTPESPVAAETAEPAKPQAIAAPSYTNSTPIDLTPLCNGALDKQWNRTSYSGDDLAELPTGVQVFEGVRFDIQGVIQLQGREWEKRGLKFPKAAEGIAIVRKCDYLYLLHADGGAHAPTGATVARLILHYSDGSTNTIDIKHDVHVKDWWSYNRPPPSDPNTVVAWTGQNKATTARGTSIRLYMTRFENPEPTKKVEYLDYVSAMEAPGPFMVGLAVE